MTVTNLQHNTPTKSNFFKIKKTRRIYVYKSCYIIDLEGPERAYWSGTESGLLGAFHFDGACTAGDGSCDVASHTMGTVFCNLPALG